MAHHSFSRSNRIATLALTAGIMLAAFFFSAETAFAQEGDPALRETIRSAILSDPRSASMTPTEVDAMVAALTRQAESVGMTAEDIVWRPVEEQSGSAQGNAQGTPCEGFLCSLNNAFGFDGSDYTIPVMLGASALMLIFIIAAILEYRHIHRKKLANPSEARQPPPAGQ